MRVLIPWSGFYQFFFFQAEDGIRDHCVTGVQTCALPISKTAWHHWAQVIFLARARSAPPRPKMPPRVVAAMALRTWRREVAVASALVNSSKRDESIYFSSFAGRPTQLQREVRPGRTRLYALSCMLAARGHFPWARARLSTSIDVHLSRQSR